MVSFSVSRIRAVRVITQMGTPFPTHPAGNLPDSAVTSSLTGHLQTDSRGDLFLPSAFNNESQLLALDRHVGAQMDSIFMNDLKSSKEIKLDEFRKRPLSGKILEWGAQKLRRVL